MLRHFHLPDGSRPPVSTHRGKMTGNPLEDLHQELNKLAENYGTTRYKNPYINILRGVKDNGPWEESN